MRSHGVAIIDAWEHQGQNAYSFRLPSSALACAPALIEVGGEYGTPAAVSLHLDVLTRDDLTPSREVLGRVAELAGSGASDCIITTRIVRDLASRVDLTFEPHSGDPSEPESLCMMHEASSWRRQSTRPQRAVMETVVHVPEVTSTGTESPRPPGSVKLAVYAPAGTLKAKAAEQ